MGSVNKINCFRCKHFSTTWNPVFPRACKAYGFKTKEVLSTYIKKVTGAECMQFQPKSPANRNHSSGFQSRFNLRL
ncbi:hypothetical protein HM131_03840 [Halobacillus mangrovi]|uniref:Uracil-DNA glycosylase n=1 Tax=Halobacillus mangrovi TaxID=402384 RepID=A0A1W5ZRT7_9BACI|nr:hypothetical protein HM131_03840 [Halobacillus mangrovi]